MLIAFQNAFAQRQLTGSVKDATTNLPLIGANIIIQGTKNGVTTSADGKFSIQLTKDAKNIIVSYVGFDSKTISVNGLNQIDVLLTSSNELEETVVIGYTSQRKKDLTGAVSVVELSPVKNNSSGNIMQSLQGRVAGLYIERDGSPNGSNGRILIRGANTLGNNDPLYVIDGIPTTRPEVFQNLNPTNISSVLYFYKP